MRIQPPQNTYFAFLVLVFMGVGFFGAYYYLEHKTQFAKQRYSTAEILRTRAMNHRLHRVEYQVANLQSQVTELNLKATEAYSQSSYEETQNLTKFLGFVQQEGDGLEIVVKDSKKPLLLGDNPNTAIVHNTDLVQLVNDLRKAEAKAISINNQPVTNFTAISCSGPIILVNGSRIASPFIIRAVGDAHKMKQYLLSSDSFARELEKYGIEVNITPKKVSVPAYSPEFTRL